MTSEPAIGAGLWRYQGEQTMARAAYGHCRNSRCGERFTLNDPPPLIFCPSCWWMAKTSFAVGSLTVAVLAAIVGALARWLL